MTKYTQHVHRRPPHTHNGWCADVYFACLLFIIVIIVATTAVGCY